MIESNHTSRLIYAKGDAIIKHAFSKSNENREVEDGRCAYLLRLELASKGHPEIKKDIVNFNVKDIYLKIYGKMEGDMLNFEQLVSQQSQMPDSRAVSEIADDTLTSIFDQRYNLNMLILSNFSGYYQFFDRSFDNEKTYFPVIQEACNEILKEL